MKYKVLIYTGNDEIDKANEEEVKRMNKQQTYPSKKWSRKGQCPVCRVGTGSYHSVYCDWYVKNSAAMKLGKLGGQKTAKLYGKDHFSQAGKKGMKKRWLKKKSSSQD